MRFSLVVALTASASLASAVPFDWSGDDSNIVDSHSWGACKRRCSLSKATLPVVPGINFTTPAPDVAKHPRAIGLGVGVQVSAFQIVCAFQSNKILRSRITPVLLLEPMRTLTRPDQLSLQ